MKSSRDLISNWSIQSCNYLLLFFLLIGTQLFGQDEYKQDYSWAHCCSVVKNVSYGDEKNQRLDIYMQGNWVGEPAYFAPDTLPKPTIVFIHGGAWLIGSKGGFVNEGFFLHFLNRGWNVVNLEYRLGKGTAPQAADDAICAVKWVVENAEKFNIDTANIVLSGASAGGHLSLIAGLRQSIPGSHTCTLDEKINIRAIINWFGVSEIAILEEYLKTREWNYVLDWVGNPEEVASISRNYSPIHFVTSNAPPVITIHGELDSMVPFNQAELLHKALEKANVRNQLVSFKDGKHMGFTKDQLQLMYEKIFLFLDVDK